MGGEMVHSGWTSRAASRVARAKHRLTAACLVAAIATTPSAYGQLRDSAAKLIARTMGNPEFRPKSFRGGTWLGNGDFYLDLEPSASGIGSDLVKYAMQRVLSPDRNRRLRTLCIGDWQRPREVRDRDR